MLIMIINDDGQRLCQDKQWRKFANYGTFPSCIKTYRTTGGAKAMAQRLKARIVAIPTSDEVKREVDSCGKVIEKRNTPDKPDHETITHKALEDFVVEDFSLVPLSCLE